MAAEVPVEEAVRPRAPIVPPGEHPRAPPPVEVSEHQSAWYLGLSGCAFGGKGLPTTGGALVEARVLAGEYRLQLSVGLLAVRVVDSEAGRYRYQAIPALLTISRPLPFAGWLEPGLGVAATWASSERAAADFDAVSRLLPGVAATATARLSVGRLNVALGLWSLAQAPQRQLDDEGQVVFEYPALSAGGSLGVEIGE